MGKFWKQASIALKIQIALLVFMAIIAIRVGLGYLTGEFVVQSTPETNTTTNYDCVYSENMDDYYCPDPPEQDVNEFPARP